jgi:hypothetical protein
MTRCRMLNFTLAFLPMAAVAAFFTAPTANAQAPGYLPPEQAYPSDAPRSIRPPQPAGNPGYGQPYTPPPPSNAPGGNPPPPGDAPPPAGAYSSNEVVEAGNHFFGSASEGLAKVVEYSFQRNGHPTGYVLGEEAGGAVVAGLRYGEGTLYTKGFPPQKVYWQGPSLGYDFGANGSKSFTLVYNLQYPAQLYERYAGIDGSAYLVGGVGITFQQHDDVILAPIRAGLGLRLGANVGYLKYTPSPTWNPF